MIELTKIEKSLCHVVSNMCVAFSNRESLRKLHRADSKRKGSYPYIPFDIQQFVQFLLIVKERLKGVNTPTFIDYGAGIGQTLVIAYHLGFLANGIEIDDICIINSVSSNLTKGDLKDKSVFNNNEYDVVYYYSPFSNHEEEISFELKAIHTVKVGGYIIAPSPGNLVDFYNHFNKKDSCVINKKNLKEETNFFNKMKNFEQVVISDRYYPIFKRIK